ncbi:sushi domain-containing protein 5 [Lissotriton helveticus]
MGRRDWPRGSLAAAVVLLHLAVVQADGKLFTVESKNGSQGLDLAGAQSSCGAQGSRLATAEELRRAVQECPFTVCTRGWLADATIGSTVCTNMGSGQHVMKAIDVNIESPSLPSDHFDAFCIKDGGKLCGDPPSFPHTILHGHSEFEMGDELLYVCAQGYVMGNRQAAFTLLCDSCGEWYGQVQACVKDDALPHIDYEDKFPDDRTMSLTEPDEDDGEEDGEVEEFPFSKEMETGQEEAQGIFDLIETESKAPTESPVSLLSQKHLFWFPPEVFNEPEGEREQEGGTKTDFSNGNNHIGVKTDFSEPGTKVVSDNEEFPIGHSVVTKDTKTKELVASTDESWLDGYPVTLDAVEEGEKRDGSMELDEVTLLATDQPNYGEDKKKGVTTPIAERDVNHIVVSPTEFLNYGIKRAQVPLTPVIAPENGTTGKRNDDMGGYIPTTEGFFTTKEPTTAEELFELPGTPPTAVLETYVTVRPIDHIPAPTEAGETTTYLTPEDGKTRPEQATVGSTDTSTLEGASEGRTVKYELGGERLATSEPCSKDCQGSSHGLLIAVVVTVLCLLLLSTVLAVWCYKKRQQKSSVYKLNGKGQTRHPQHIEMQKV